MPTSQIIQEFITLWVVIDPIGTIPVFIAVTANYGVRARRAIALRAVAVSAVVLLSFIVLGQLVLEALGLGLPSFQIAGGIVLFVFAMTMIFGPSKPQAELKGDGWGQTAVHPVAIPSIASPGAMLAVVVLTDNDRFSAAHQAQTALILLAVLTITLVLMLLANPILKVIGAAGASVVSRVMGMVLAAVAVDAVLKGLVQIGALDPF